MAGPLGGGLLAAAGGYTLLFGVRVLAERNSRLVCRRGRGALPICPPLTVLPWGRIRPRSADEVPKALPCGRGAHTYRSEDRRRRSSSRMAKPSWSGTPAKGPRRRSPRSRSGVGPSAAASYGGGRALLLGLGTRVRPAFAPPRRRAMGCSGLLAVGDRRVRHTSGGLAPGRFDDLRQLISGRGALDRGGGQGAQFEIVAAGVGAQPGKRLVHRDPGPPVGHNSDPGAGHRQRLRRRRTHSRRHRPAAVASPDERRGDLRPAIDRDPTSFGLHRQHRRARGATAGRGNEPEHTVGDIRRRPNPGSGGTGGGPAPRRQPSWCESSAAQPV